MNESKPRRLRRSSVSSFTKLHGATPWRSVFRSLPTLAVEDTCCLSQGPEHDVRVLIPAGAAAWMELPEAADGLRLRLTWVDVLVGLASTRNITVPTIRSEHPPT